MNRSKLKTPNFIKLNFRIIKFDQKKKKKYEALLFQTRSPGTRIARVTTISIHSRWIHILLRLISPSREARSWKTVSERIFRGPRVSTTWKQLCPPLIAARPRELELSTGERFPGEIESKPRFDGSDLGLARAFPTSSMNIRARSEREMKINDGNRSPLALLRGSFLGGKMNPRICGRLHSDFDRSLLKERVTFTWTITVFSRFGRVLSSSVNRGAIVEETKTWSRCDFY